MTHNIYYCDLHGLGTHHKRRSVSCAQGESRAFVVITLSEGYDCIQENDNDMHFAMHFEWT